MGKPILLTKGMRFGKLTVLEFSHRKKRSNGYYRNYWLCKCDCGNEKIIEESHIKSGHTKSCGCLNIEKFKNFNHGKSNTRLYKIYNDIKKRCLNKNCKNYKDYGGRGITMCDEWLNDFMNFYNWSMENGYKENLTIDRIDVNGNYEPSNCRWVTMKIQQNNKTNNHLITYNNKIQNIMLWCMELNLDYYTILQRIKKLKWDIDRVFLTPTKRGFNELRH